MKKGQSVVDGLTEGYETTLGPTFGGRDLSGGEWQRLATARTCDRILVIDNGRIVEDGDHETLLAEDGLYAQFFKAQAQWYVWEYREMKLYEGFSTGLSVLLQDKMRSVLTMLGIVIGVAAVLAMLAIGDGAKRIVMQEFEKFGGHFFVRRNPWIWRGDRVFPNRSGEHIKYADVLAIEAECPSVECVIPSISDEVLVQTREGAMKWTEYNGVNSYFPVGMKWEIQQGRFFTEEEFTNRRKVCVLGLEVATEIFGNQNPLGKEVKISRQGGKPDRFRILGVMAKRGRSLQYGFSWDDVVFIPLTTAQDRFKGKRHVNYLNIRAVDTDVMEKAADEVRAVLRNGIGIKTTSLILVMQPQPSKNSIKSVVISKSCSAALPGSRYLSGASGS